MYQLSGLFIRKSAIRLKQWPVPQVAWVIGAILLASLLSFRGLTNHAFWDDESNTALFARNLLDQGRLTAWDGTNLVGYRSAAELNAELINVYMPPLQYYVASIGLKTFGHTTFGGRVLFVLSGLVALGFLAIWARRFMGEKTLWYLPPVLVALAPAYLLYIRQCRYYSLSVLLTMVLLAAWADPRGDRRREVISTSLGTVATAGLIFTNYLNAAAALGVLPLFFLLAEYRKRSNYMFLGIVYSVAALLGVYLLITANPFQASVAPTDSIPAVQRFFTLVGWHLRGLGTFEFFPVLVVPALVLPWIVNTLGVYRPLALRGLLLLGVMVGYTLVTALFTPQPVSETKVADMRYLVPLIAVGAVVTAMTLNLLWHLARPAALIMAALLVFTNIGHLAFFGSRPVACTMCQYLGELENDYITGTEGMLEYLAGQPAATVVKIEPGYMAYAPMFYHPRLHYCCQLSDAKQISPDLQTQLPDYLYEERVGPDVVLAGGRNAQRVQRDLRRRYGPRSYSVEQVLPVDWHDRSRPELPWRVFEASPPKDPARQGIVVLRRRVPSEISRATNTSKNQENGKASSETDSDVY